MGEEDRQMKQVHYPLLLFFFWSGARVTMSRTCVLLGTVSALMLMCYFNGFPTLYSIELTFEL